MEVDNRSAAENDIGFSKPVEHEELKASPSKVATNGTNEDQLSAKDRESVATNQNSTDAVLSGRKPLLVRNTFIGGVRYFAPSEDVIPLSDDDEISPFEPSRPRFQSSRSATKHALQDDTGERPFLIFGDIEDKISELQLDPESGEVRAAVELKNRRERDYFKRSGHKNVEPELVFAGSTMDNSPSGVQVDLSTASDGTAAVRSTPSAAAARKKQARDVDRLTAKDAFMPRSKQAAAKSRKSMPASVLVEPSSIMRPEPDEEVSSATHKALTAEEQLKADANALIASVLAKGTRVLAKWLDKNLYPGIIVRNDVIIGYKVRFTDGESREMPSIDVVPLFRLKEGDELMLSVTSRRGEYEFQPSVITKCPDRKNAEQWSAGMFEVENRTKLITETVSWERLAIESRQLKNYVTQKRTVTSLSQIAPIINESIDSGARRSLRPKRPKLLIDDFGDSVADEDAISDNTADVVGEDATVLSRRSRIADRGGARGARRGRVSHGGLSRGDDVDARSTLSSERKKLTSRDRTDSKGMDISTPFRVPKLKPPSLAPESEFSRNKEQRSSSLGQQKSVDRSLFSDMKFLLTSATRVKDTSTSGDGAPPIKPFVKRQVRQMIEERCGIVIEDFSQIVGSMSDTYLVADQFYRTHKYLSALVRAVPCVSHMWIYECCKENRLLHPTIFMLPAGRMLESNEIIKWHDKCPTLLTGLNVYMHTENKPENPNMLNFVQIWTPIAKVMGANIISKLPDADQDPATTKIDILLTDSSCPAWIVERCKLFGAHAVSSEWLIQGIIAGRLPQVDAHPKYMHDYSDQPPSLPAAQSQVVQDQTLNVSEANISEVKMVASSTVTSTYPVASVQPQEVAMEETAFVDPGSLTEAIDISNMTAEQLQALGIQFVDAGDLTSLSTDQNQQVVQPVIDLQHHQLVDQLPLLQHHGEQPSIADPEMSADENVIMISPEDLQLLNQEGVQIISQNGVIIVQRADGTQTVVGQIGAGEAQIQIVESAGATADTVYKS